MTQYPTCRHVKEDGAYCGSPALQRSKYCHYHLQHRVRRLRRARALRDNLPYRMELEPLDSLYATRSAVSQIVQALGSGQLDQRVAGKMLYGIQLATTLTRRIAEAEARAQAQSEVQAEAANQTDQQQASPAERVLDCPPFEQELGLQPGSDLDAKIDLTLQQAEKMAKRRSDNGLPDLPPGVLPGTARYKLFCDETYQMQRYRIERLEEELYEYHQMKRKQNAIEAEKFRQESLAFASKKDAASTISDEEVTTKTA